MKTLYDVLGVPADATESELLRAYRTRATELHPDHSAADDATESMRDLNAAWFVLCDAERRAAYDNAIGHRDDGIEDDDEPDRDESDDLYADTWSAGGRLRFALMVATVLTVAVVVVLWVLAFRGSGDLGSDSGGYGN